MIAANAIEAGAKETEDIKTLAGPASKITRAPDIEGQRIAYSQLSKQLETLIRKEGLSGGQLYVDYCPMALNDEGATWISSHKQISNPYFGNEMLSCGEVQDTIK